MQRFKYLVDMVKKKKEKEAELEEDLNPPQDLVKPEETEDKEGQCPSEASS